MITGGSMLLAGWLILLFTVIEIIPVTVWLPFVAYALSLVGFTVGMVGVIMYMRTGQNR